MDPTIAFVTVKDTIQKNSSVILWLLHSLLLNLTQLNLKHLFKDHHHSQVDQATIPMKMIMEVMTVDHHTDHRRHPLQALEAPGHNNPAAIHLTNHNHSLNLHQSQLNLHTVSQLNLIQDLVTVPVGQETYTHRMMTAVKDLTVGQQHHLM